LTAAAVAGRPRLGRRALGPDRNALQRVDPRDRAAAGADLDHFDHGNAHRQARTFQEARSAIDLEHARGLGLIFLDQANLRGGATHIEGQDLGLAKTSRNLRRENRAARRARLDKAHRKALRRLDRRDAAT
jgi:hypothetical protein